MGSLRDLKKTNITASNIDFKPKFVVCINESSALIQDRITEFFKNEDCGFWHYFRDMWLVTDENKKWTANTLRDKIERFVSNPILVINIEGTTTWAGFGQEKMFPWLHKIWDDKKETDRK